MRLRDTPVLTKTTLDDYISCPHVEPTEELTSSLSFVGHKNSAIDNNEKQVSNDNTTHENTRRDPDGILASLPWLKCYFCNRYKTPIQFDIELHLYEKHRWELLKKLPLKGKAYSMDYRIAYVIEKTKGRL